MMDLDPERHQCWNCGLIPDGMLGTAPRRVRQGDASFCWSCGRLGVIGPQGQPTRRPTTNELVDFMSDPRIAIVRQHWHATHGGR